MRVFKPLVVLRTSFDTVNQLALIRILEQINGNQDFQKHSRCFISWQYFELVCA